MKMNWLKTCKEIGEEISKEVLAIYESGKRRTEIGKGFGGDITLHADKIAEELAIKKLKKLNKKILLISEEIGEVKLNFKDKPEYIIMLDPLDGSFNFKSGVDHFAVSIAILDSNFDTLVGYLRNIVNGNEYHALKGKGSFKNGKKIHTSKAKTPHNTLFEISPKASKADFEFIIKGFLTSRHNRGLGAVALDFGFVADGTFDALVYAGANRFLDVAAGIFIVRQAGGVVTDFNRNEQMHKGTKLVSRNIIAAANKNVLDSFLKHRFILEQK